MKDTFKLILVLTVICLVAGLLLGGVNTLTQERIQQALREEKLAALREVLPAYDNEPDADAVIIEDRGRSWTFYVAREGATFSGAAFETASEKGYGGLIGVMVGVTADGRVNGLEILSQKETPGLGARIQEPAFKQQFAGRSIHDTVWAVRKDQGDIDEITAATISSRAVVEAIKTGLDVYEEHAALISGAVARPEENQ